MERLDEHVTQRLIVPGSPTATRKAGPSPLQSCKGKFSKEVVQGYEMSGFGTHWFAGALCTPASNCAGRTLYEMVLVLPS